MDDERRHDERPDHHDDTVDRGTGTLDGQADGRKLFTDIDELDPEVDEAGDLLPDDRRPAEDDVVGTVPGPGGGNPNQPVVGIGEVAKATRNP